MNNLMTSKLTSKLLLLEQSDGSAQFDYLLMTSIQQKEISTILLTIFGMTSFCFSSDVFHVGHGVNPHMLIVVRVLARPGHYFK